MPAYILISKSLTHKLVANATTKKEPSVLQKGESATNTIQHLQKTSNQKLKVTTYLPSSKQKSFKPAE